MKSSIRLLNGSVSYRSNKNIYFINFLYLIGIFFDSILYIHIPALSLQNILFFPTLIINIINISKKRLSKALIEPIIWLSVYLIIITFCSLLISTDNYNNFNNLKVVLYQIQILGVFVIPISCPDLLGTGGIRIVKFMMFFWVVWAILQICTIIGLMPPSFQFLFSRGAGEDPEAMLQINGPYGNSNDFGCVVLLVFLLILFFTKLRLYSNIYFYLTFIVVTVTISRTAMILFLLIIIGKDWILKKNQKLVAIVSVGIIIFFTLIATKDLWVPSVTHKLEKEFGYTAITINFKRITSILDITDQNVEDGSVNYRSQSYKYAISNLPTHVDALGYQNYGEFYKAGNFVDHLVWINPHSYLIEIGIAYGLPALLSFLMFLCSILVCTYKSKINTRKKRFIYLTVLYTIILSNVPSSILLLPIFWLPLSFIYVSSQTKGV